MTSGKKAKRARRGRTTASTTDLLVGLLRLLPLDAMPLMAPVFIVHQSLAGAPAGTCVTTCHTLATGLRHLGLAAEPMAAAAVVSRSDITGTAAGEYCVGVQDAPPVVRPDGTTNGHMILWVDSLHRLVDPTVSQEPRLLMAAQGTPTMGVPAVLSVKDRDTLLSIRPATMRGPYRVVWSVFPEWTAILDQVLTAPMRESVAYGGLNLAHKSLEVLRELVRQRDLVPVLQRHARLAALMSGEISLPALPAADTLSLEARRLLRL